MRDFLKNNWQGYLLTRKCVADGGKTGELKAYIRENSVQIKFVAISEFGGISGAV